MSEKLRPIYYDTETTGVKSDKDRIIEIAAFDVEKKTPFNSLVNPTCHIPKEASAIHNITDEMVANSPTFDEVGAQFSSFCSGNVVLIAHNNDAFDKPFLECEFDRNNISFPNWKFIDSLKFSRKYRPDLPRHSLQHLREYYGIEANNAHRALDDVIILHQVFSEMIDDLSMDQIIELMNSKQKIRHMPFGKHQGKPLEEIPKGYIKWLEENNAFEKPDNAALKEAFEDIGMISK